MLDALRTGGKRALADALVRLESEAESAATAALLDEALVRPQGIALGLTGPPGVGKSTLTDALIRHWRGEGRTVGVIAVDPSSQISGGALLGDRTRFTQGAADPGVFVRSMAARDRLGGLAAMTFPAMVLMRALYDIVVVETVGVGQSETEIAKVADLVALCAQPGSGDSLQYMKAGIMEIPDMVIVTKADMGTAAQRTLADLRGGLSLASGQHVPEIVSCSATSATGIDVVARAFSDRAAQILPDLAESRLTKANRWVEAQLTTRFGTFGLELIHKCPESSEQRLPFGRRICLSSRLSAAITATFR